MSRSVVPSALYRTHRQPCTERIGTDLLRPASPTLPGCRRAAEWTLAPFPRQWAERSRQARLIVPSSARQLGPHSTRTQRWHSSLRSSSSGQASGALAGVCAGEAVRHHAHTSAAEGTRQSLDAVLQRIGETHRNLALRACSPPDADQHIGMQAVPPRSPGRRTRTYGASSCGSTAHRIGPVLRQPRPSGSLLSARVRGAPSLRSTGAGYNGQRLCGAQTCCSPGAAVHATPRPVPTSRPPLAHRAAPGQLTDHNRTALHDGTSGNTSIPRGKLADDSEGVDSENSLRNRVKPGKLARVAAGCFASCS